MTTLLSLIRPILSTYGRNSFVLRQPSRQLKSALKFKWVRPEPIPCILPEQSGDLEPLGTLEMTQFPTPYKASKELQSACELVQRIHTLEFLHRDKLKEEFIMAYSNRVKAHQYDDDSPEVIIAVLTAKIRNLQIHMQGHRRDTINKVRLKVAIDKRNKYISQLRTSDYKKYEWLLEKLNLIHKVFSYNGQERVERKRSLRRLTALYIEKLKAERLAEYKTFLEAQQKDFLIEKLEKLNWIRKSEEECGVQPTVSESDIESVQNQLKALQITKSKAILT